MRMAHAEGEYFVSLIFVGQDKTAKSEKIDAPQNIAPYGITILHHKRYFFDHSILFAIWTPYCICWLVHVYMHV